MRLPQFTLKHLLGLTFSVAFVIGGLMCFYRMGQINPDSEAIMVAVGTDVNGKVLMEPFEPNWVKQPILKGDVDLPTVQPNPNAIVVWKQPGIQFKEYELMRISYKNYFGSECFAVHVSAKIRPAGNAMCAVQCKVSGGGITDGSTRCSFEKILRNKFHLNLIQWIHNARISKKTSLWFTHNGKHFTTSNP